MTRILYASTLLAVLALLACDSPATETAKAASEHTRAANAAVYEQLDFANRSDFEDADRGLIAATPDLRIEDKDGNVVWDMQAFRAFLEGDAPDTVNPSLWRQALLSSRAGLYEVADGIYQVRGYDITTMSVIRGDDGWIVIDPLTTKQVAAAAMALVNEHLGERPVTAVIYTHTHGDHWGGVKGIVSQADVDDGRTKIIAPELFMENVASEFVLLGNAMTRRTHYMHAMLLPKGVRGQVDNGLGKALAGGDLTLIEPTHYVTHTGQVMTVDGVEIEFQLTPEAEADAEIMFYFPKQRALMGAENLNASIHNVLTPRGTKIRDALNWSKALGEALELFGDRSDVVFTSHYWPRWGQENVRNFIAKQRDMLRYIHDQTIRLANHGYTMIEIAEMIELPPSLRQEWFNRGYYGTVAHNVKAVYQRYIGFWTGNPATLHQLPPAAAGARYVEALGGAEAVIDHARQATAEGEYRWGAMLLDHLVASDPDNTAARELQADIFEQLGYQAESGSWRNIYLTGAMELRHGIVPLEGLVRGTTPDLLRAMSTDQIFDFLAVRLNGPKAEGHELSINWILTDNERYAMRLENSVLNSVPGKVDESADLSLTITRQQLDQVLLGEISLGDLAAAGEIGVEGDMQALQMLFSLLDNFDIWFDIVTPVNRGTP